MRLAGKAMVIHAMHLAKRCHREIGIKPFSTKYQLMSLAMTRWEIFERVSSLNTRATSLIVFSTSSLYYLERTL